MSTRMLIDARHREETRVAVVKGNRIEEFDFESAEHKQLKGNIYLAKVTRVEPSLQAAFVEYGGNRHGFLAFSEIHPDYFQIPKEDRDALMRDLAEQAAADAAMRAEEEMEELEGEVEDITPPLPLDGEEGEEGDDSEDLAAGDDALDDGAEDGAEHDAGNDDADAENGDARRREGGPRERRGRRRGRARGDHRGQDGQNGDDASYRRSPHRRYKIQDVIRRRQVLLVQVVKEERGNKGAALTSYLSLAGRYCVLMPNSSHGGGISRKINSASDRKRLKSVIDDLGLPSSMGCIVRTAGMERTKTEIKRDFDYLARLWDEIREKTLDSQAPALIHSDSDLIKRAIRDIYNSDIDEVLVEGDEGYRAAKDFMKLLMPSHARRVKHYGDTVSLFQRYGAEDQLSAMYQPLVQLKSGGYLIINPTEALVSIDINSGRSTREHNIEQTALNTNLEAAYEIARQLRLRDMAGLVVIDFIDMEVGSHVRKVERAMRDALKNDRARIQLGRISGFGLMEMSRQRLRTGVLEASTRACPHCEGTGLVRTASSAGLSALRLLEEEAARGLSSRLVLRASQEATIYVLNNKRAELAEIEARYGVRIDVLPDGETEGARMTVDGSGPPPERRAEFTPIRHVDEDDGDVADFEGDDADGGEDASPRDARDGDRNGRKRRRRRGGQRRDAHDRDSHRSASGGDSESEVANDAPEAAPRNDGDGEDHGGYNDSDNAEDGKARRRRRGRRGGRARRDREAGSQSDIAAEMAGDSSTSHSDAPEDSDNPVSTADDAAGQVAAPAKPKRRSRKAAATEAAAEVATEAGVAALPDADAAEAAPVKPKRAPRKAKTASEAAAPAEDAQAKPARRSRKKADDTAGDAANDSVQTPAAAEAAAPVTPVTQAESVAAEGEVADDATPRRRGWWQKTFG
ncbi:MAG: Rne/Rng family ribonuclease [Sphingomonadaceae bacterium]|nr:Rne/Rng family ribonuclease [Sphingomonadaceae bacterium]